MLGRSVGLSDAELAAVASWKDSDMFDDRDRAVLSYADAVSIRNTVSEETYEELSRNFTRPEIVKICIAVSFAGLVNRVHATFRTDLDQTTLDSVADAPFCLIDTPT